MQPYTDETLILGRRNYGEADLVLTVLTKEHGKITALAKGIRKSTSKLGQGTDLFSYSKLQLTPGKGEMLILTGAQRVGGAIEVKDLLHMTALSTIAEGIERMTEGGMGLDSTVFSLVQKSFENGSKEKSPYKTVIWFFQRLFSAMGIGLQVFECVDCGEKLQPVPALLGHSRRRSFMSTLPGNRGSSGFIKFLESSPASSQKG